MIERDNLESLFQQHKGTKCLLVMPGGNHGDYLIYFGLHQMLARAQITFDQIDERGLAQVHPDAYDVIYLHGSGGYNEWSSGAAERILQSALRLSSSLVIQGPCSVSESETYAQGLFARLRKFSDKRLIFYSREYTTHRLLQFFEQQFSEQRSADHASFQAGLNFDTALFARKSDLERSFGSCKEYYRLYAMREDNEKPVRGLHDFGPGITLDPARYCTSFAHWVKVHARAREIITTRTHSAVIGAILGKKTILYPNSYHKNRSIWEYSLRDMGVLWGPDTLNRPVRSASLPRLIPQKILSSYKVGQVIRWAHKVPLQ